MTFIMVARKLSCATLRLDKLYVEGAQDVHQEDLGSVEGAQALHPDDQVVVVQQRGLPWS